MGKRASPAAATFLDIQHVIKEEVSRYLLTSYLEPYEQHLLSLFKITLRAGTASTMLLEVLSLFKSVLVSSARPISPVIRPIDAFKTMSSPIRTGTNLIDFINALRYLESLRSIPKRTNTGSITDSLRLNSYCTLSINFARSLPRRQWGI